MKPWRRLAGQGTIRFDRVWLDTHAQQWHITTNEITGGVVLFYLADEEMPEQVPPTMDVIPVVVEASTHSTCCYGCGSGACMMHFLSFRVSDIGIQQVSWCSQCASIVMNFLEERVLCVKEVGHE